MKKTLEQRLRGGFSKLSINRQYVKDWTGVEFGDVAWIDGVMIPSENLGPSPYGGAIGSEREAKDSTFVDLPSIGAQMHIHDGITGRYGSSDGQSMAHLKEYGSKLRVHSLNSYDAAMADARARQMNLPSGQFATMSNSNLTQESINEVLSSKEYQEFQQKASEYLAMIRFFKES